VNGNSGSQPGVPRFLLAAFLLCVGLILGRWLGSWLDRSPRPAAPVAGNPNAAAPEADTHRELRSGPWGALEILKIEIERPDEFISSTPPAPIVSRWFFPGFSTNQLLRAFNQDDLTREQKDALLDPRRWEIQTNGIYVTPGSDIILSLSPEARQRLYSILAATPANLAQQWAFRIRSDEVNDWFDRSGLSPDTVSLVKRLLYRRGDTTCFSDLNELLAVLPSDAEKHRVIKMFSRQSAVLPRLRVAEGEDVEPLVRYWANQGGAKDIRPLLASLARTPGGASLDITHLLPPFARMRVYTYPFPSEDPWHNRRDCAWTSMNFFNREPDDRFYDFAATRETIARDYYPIQDEPAFGDIVWFSDAGGQTLHIAVYIAADIVFTKNGATFNEPWTLMEMKDLLADYAPGVSLHTTIYRRKPY
jgi:hypothetical protein